MRPGGPFRQTLALFCATLLSAGSVITVVATSVTGEPEPVEVLTGPGDGTNHGFAPRHTPKPPPTTTSTTVVIVPTTWDSSLPIASPNGIFETPNPNPNPSVGGSPRVTVPASPTPRTDPPTRPAPTTTTTTPTTPKRVGSHEEWILGGHNYHRLRGNLRQVTRNPCLDHIATTWAETMAHTKQATSNPRYISAAAQCVPGWITILETVTTGTTVEEIMSTMMSDPRHSTNVMAPNVTDLGVGVWADQTGTLWACIVYVANGG